MTTIIVVVVVALVFFVAVCVVAFMIWKREAEMRTDSIRAIEENLERLTQEMSSEQEIQDRQSFAGKEAGISYMESLIEQSAAGKSAGRRTRRPGQDPFEWVRANGETVRSSSGSEQEKPFRIKPVPDFEEGRQEKPDRGEGFDPYDLALTDSDTVPDGISQNEQDNGQAGAAERGYHGDDMAELPEDGAADAETADAQEPSQMRDRHAGSGMDDDADSGTSADAAVSEGGKVVRTPVQGTEVCRKKTALTEMQKMLKELDVPELRTAPKTQKEADAGATGLSAEATAERPEMREHGNEDHEHYDDREEQHDEKESYEISLDLIDEMDIDSEQEQMPPARMGYDVGRSGRKYTASELEKLIKE